MWDIYSRSGVCLRPDTERQVFETIHQRSVSRAAKGRKLDGGGVAVLQEHEYDSQSEFSMHAKTNWRADSIEGCVMLLEFCKL